MGQGQYCDVKHITIIMPMQYKQNSRDVKIYIFQSKKFGIFNIIAQNIDCGYMLEPPR